MCMEVERPRLAECGERALHHEPLAPVKLGAEPFKGIGRSSRGPYLNDVRSARVRE